MQPQKSHPLRSPPRPAAGWPDCLTIVVDEIDVPSCSPALSESLAPPLGLYSADAISRELVEKKYSALAVGELREKKSEFNVRCYLKRLVPRFRRCSSKILGTVIGENLK
jgi:hypothetical protein